MQKKEQTAMKFLMNHSWAILIAIIVIGILGVYFFSNTWNAGVAGRGVELELKNNGITGWAIKGSGIRIDNIVVREVLSFGVDVIIINPVDNAILFNNENITLNFSVINHSPESPIDTCWWTINGWENHTVEYCNDINDILISVPIGDVNLSVYANDSVGNLGGDSVSFSVGETIYNCGVLSEKNAVYRLGTDVLTDDFCFIIGADDITIDFRNRCFNR